MTAILNNSFKMCVLKCVCHLLAAGLPDLLHLIVFALHLLGMSLTEALRLHLQTKLGLEHKHRYCTPQMR